LDNPPRQNSGTASSMAMDFLMYFGIKVLTNGLSESCDDRLLGTFTAIGPALVVIMRT